MYYKGFGVDVDYTQALVWIEMAAAQGSPEAMSHLGKMYFSGEGVTPSWRRARECFSRASELGSPQASASVKTLATGIQNAAPLMDKRVEIQGPSHAVPGGKRGVVTDFHPVIHHDRSSWRYTVKLDSNEEAMLRLADVRAEGGFLRWRVGQPGWLTRHEKSSKDSRAFVVMT
mmetsp:Transcript_6646/g.16902  ORF Transcript_6646/g.16902 Transcript_6646/m.16902 type:complete len:173 (-) Transcript_6646:304-822(-)